MTNNSSKIKCLLAFCALWLLSGGVCLGQQLEFDEADLEEDEVTLARPGYSAWDGSKLAWQEIPGEEAVAVGASTDEAWRVALLVRMCAAELHRRLGDWPSGMEMRQLVFQAVDASRPEAMADVPQSSFVGIDSSLGIDAAAVVVCRAFARRRLRAMLKIRRGAPVGRIYDCVAAALAYRISSDTNMSGLYRPDYGLVRKQFAAGVFPDVKILLEQPLPIRAPSSLLKLYLADCEVLMACLERSVIRQSLAQLLDRWMVACNASDRVSASSALAQALGLGNADNSLQLWYEPMATEVTRRYRAIMDAEECQTELQQLLVLSVLDASSSSGIRTIPLRKVPEILPDYRLDGFALSNLMTRLLALRQTAPPLLQGALEAYQQSIDTLIRGEIRAFKKEYDAADKAFREAMEHQRLAEAMLGADESDASRSIRMRDWQRVLEFYEKSRSPVDDAVFGL